MRGIEDMRFATVKTRSGAYVGKVAEFPNLRTRPYPNRLDAISAIITLTIERIQEIDETREIRR